MSQEQQNRSPGMFPYLVAPLAVLGWIIGLALMLGRSRSRRKQPVRPARKALEDLGLQRAVEAAQQAIHEARSQIDAKDATRKVSTLVGTTKTTLPPLTQEATTRAKVMADELGQRLKTDVAPTARVWAQGALDEAEDILSTARERAADLTQTARKDYGPEVSARAGDAAGLLAGTAATAAHELGKWVSDVSGQRNSKKVKKQAKRRISRGANRAEGALKSAGQQSMHAAGESLRIVFWASALGVTIYYLLLAPKQRERVRSFLDGVVAQVQDVFGDFQGAENDFPPAQ